MRSAAEAERRIGGVSSRAARDYRSGFESTRPAFYRKILDYALERLRNKLEYTTVGFQLLPGKFTLTELQDVYEAILDKKLDKRNFRRKLALLKILKPVVEYRRGGQRPARLYRFVAGNFEKLKDKGILFPF